MPCRAERASGKRGGVQSVQSVQSHGRLGGGSTCLCAHAGGEEDGWLAACPHGCECRPRRQRLGTHGS